jgi:coproporphyrinogen III oxidase-like Fe-S oxidoreductase
VSNWALPGFECRAQSRLLGKQPYLGLGAGAHSYRDGRRWWSIRPPGEYLDTVEHGLRPVGGEERLTPEEEQVEVVFLTLRILEGIPTRSVAPDVAVGFLERGLLHGVDGNLMGPSEECCF